MINAARAALYPDDYDTRGEKNRTLNGSFFSFFCTELSEKRKKKLKIFLNILYMDFFSKAMVQCLSNWLRVLVLDVWNAYSHDTSHHHHGVGRPPYIPW